MSEHILTVGARLDTSKIHDQLKSIEKTLTINLDKISVNTQKIAESVQSALNSNAFKVKIDGADFSGLRHTAESEAKKMSETMSKSFKFKPGSSAEKEITSLQKRIDALKQSAKSIGGAQFGKEWDRLSDSFRKFTSQVKSDGIDTLSQFETRATRFSNRIDILSNKLSSIGSKSKISGFSKELIEIDKLEASASRLSVRTTSLGNAGLSGDTDNITKKIIALRNEIIRTKETAEPGQIESKIQKLQGEITSLTSKITIAENELKKVGAVKFVSFADAEKSITSFDAKVATLSKDMINIDDKVINDKFNGVKEKISALKESFKEPKGMDAEAFKSSAQSILNDLATITNMVRTTKAEMATEQQAKIVSFDEVKTEITDIQSKLSGLKSMVREYGTDGDKSAFSTLDLNLKTFIQDIEAGKVSFSEYQERIKQIGTDYQNLSNIISTNKNSINEALSTRTLGADAASLSEYVGKITNLQKQVQNAIKNWTKSRTGATSEEYKQLKNLYSEIGQLMAKLPSMTSKDAEESVKRLASSFSEVSGKIRVAGNDAAAFGTKLANAVRQYAAMFTGVAAITRIVQYTKKAVNATVELDSAMNQLQIVTRESNEVLSDYANNIVKIADKTAGSVTDLVDATTTYARLGYSLDQSTTLANLTQMLQNVGDIDASSAQNAITAIIKAFDIDVNDMELVLDRMVEVGNNFPISVSQLAEGLNNASSILSVATNYQEDSINSFEKSAAMLTAANVTVQNVSKSSTALRTIIARLRKMDMELDELGEVMTAADYDKLTQALTDQNVALTDQTGQLRDAYEVLRDMSIAWKDMTSNERSALAQTFGSTRNQNVFISLMENFGEAESAMGAMKKSQDALQNANETYLNSIKAHIQQLKNAFDTLLYNNGTVEFIKNVTDLGKSILQVTGYVIKLTDRIGGLKTILVALGGGVIAKLVASIMTAVKAAGSLGAAFTTFLSAHPVALVTTAIVGIVGAISAIKKAHEEALESARDAASSYNKTALSVEDYKDRVIELRSELDSGNLSEAEAKSKREELLSIQESLVEMLGKEASGLNLVTGEINLQCAAIDQLLGKKWTEYYRTNTDAVNEIVNGFVHYTPENYNENKEPIFLPFGSDLEKAFKNAGFNEQNVDAVITDFYSIIRRKLKEKFPEIDLSDITDFDMMFGQFVTDLNVDSIYDFYSAYNDLFEVFESMKALYPNGMLDSLIDESLGRYSEVLKDLHDQIEKDGEVFQRYVENLLITDSSVVTQYGKLWSSLLTEKQKYNDAIIEDDKDTAKQSYDTINELQKQFINGITFGSMSNEAVNTYLKDYFDTFLYNAQGYINGTDLQVGVNVDVDDTGTKEVASLEDTIDKIKKQVGAENVIDIIFRPKAKVSGLRDAGWDVEYSDKIAQMREEVEQLGVDVSQTVFGNIDLDNRQLLEWTEANLEKYSSAIKSWGGDIEEYAGTISTVLGGLDTEHGQSIAFSPILQTESGAVLLDKDTLGKYIDDIVDQAKADDGSWTDEELFAIDATGIEENGILIKGLIADIGETAEATSKAMHYLGNQGAIALEKEADTINELFIKTFSNDDDTIAINFTPVVRDEYGRIKAYLTPKQLDKYAKDVIDGVREDDKNLIVGVKFETEGATKYAEEAKEKLKGLLSNIETDFNLSQYTELVRTLTAVDTASKAATKALNTLNESLKKPTYREGMEARSDNFTKMMELYEKGLVGDTDFKAYAKYYGLDLFKDVDGEKVAKTYEEIGAELKAIMPFVGAYYDKNGKLVADAEQAMINWLDKIDKAEDELIDLDDVSKGTFSDLISWDTETKELKFDPSILFDEDKMALLEKQFGISMAHFVDLLNEYRAHSLDWQSYSDEELKSSLESAGMIDQVGDSTVLYTKRLREVLTALGLDYDLVQDIVERAQGISDVEIGFNYTGEETVEQIQTDIDTLIQSLKAENIDSDELASKVAEALSTVNDEVRQKMLDYINEAYGTEFGQQIESALASYNTGVEVDATEESGKNLDEIATLIADIDGEHDITFNIKGDSLEELAEYIQIITDALGENGTVSFETNKEEPFVPFQNNTPLGFGIMGSAGKTVLRNRQDDTGFVLTASIKISEESKQETAEVISDITSSLADSLDKNNSISLDFTSVIEANGYLKETSILIKRLSDKYLSIKIDTSYLNEAESSVDEVETKMTTLGGSTASLKIDDSELEEARGEIDGGDGIINAVLSIGDHEGEISFSAEQLNDPEERLAVIREWLQEQYGLNIDEDPESLDALSLLIDKLLSKWFDPEYDFNTGADTDKADQEYNSFVSNIEGNIIDILTHLGEPNTDDYNTVIDSLPDEDNPLEVPISFKPLQPIEEFLFGDVGAISEPEQSYQDRNWVNKSNAAAAANDIYDFSGQITSLGVDDTVLSEVVEIIQAYASGQTIDVPISPETEEFVQQLKDGLDLSSIEGSLWDESWNQVIIDAFDSTILKIGDTSSAIDEFNSNDLDVSQKSAALGNLSDSADGATGSEQVLIDKSNELSNTGINVTGKVSQLSNLSGAAYTTSGNIRNTTNEWYALRNSPDNINKTITTTYKTVSISEHLAKGTRNAKGGTALLGDEYNPTGQPRPELVVSNGEAFIAGIDGPTLATLKAGDVVYPYDETKKILSGGSIASIPAFAGGTINYDKIYKNVLKRTGGRGNYTDNSTNYNTYNYNAGSDSTSTDNKEEFDWVDWIEVILDRAERAVNDFKKIAENTYNSLKKRLTATGNEISVITNEIDLQEQAYERYIKQANAVGLSSDLAQLVRDGTIDIRQYDEATRELIDDYKNWYEKALSCADAVAELHNNLASLYEDNFENIQTDYENQLERFSFLTNEYNNYGRVISREHNQNIDTLRNELKDLEKAFSEAMSSGEIQSKSEAWYGMVKTIQDVRDQISEMYEQVFSDIQSNYDNQISILDHFKNSYENAMDQMEAKGRLASTRFYSALSDIEKQNVGLMQKELSRLESTLSEAVKKGEIETYSEAWYSMRKEIDGVKESIEDANLQLLEYAKSMRELDWSHFDYMQDRISKLNKETEFLINLMSNDNLYQDSGQFNREGLATLGLRVQNYDVDMAQADAYAAEIKKVNKEIAKDKYNTELIERREELLNLQRESILAAESEKNAIKYLVEEGIKIELDNLKELIDTYKESIDSAKDLYEYNKNIADQTKNIASLEKQLNAYQNDTSEETRTKVQKLRVELDDARQKLQETQYDRFVSDSKKMLDNLYDEYSDLLNSRLDDIDQLVLDMIDTVNTNSYDIKSTLYEVSDDVGYTMTTELKNVWNSANAIATYYGENFTGQLTTVNNTLNNIRTFVEALVKNSDKEADRYISETASSTATTDNATASGGSQRTMTTTPSASSASSSTLSLSRNLSYGSKGDDVKKLQQRLYDLGYLNAAPDGIFGSYTLAAVNAFQMANGIGVDGIVGPKTLEKLNGSPIKKQNAKSTTFNYSKNLSYNSKGSDVTQLQKRLAELGYYAGYIDGNFGSQTLQAVKDFQKANGIYVDGIVGKTTTKYLNGNPKLGKYMRYATGGLVTSTGMAHLDGTPQKPELVLNAEDTRNFIALKDILSDMSSPLRLASISNFSHLLGGGLGSGIGNVINGGINIRIDHVEDYNDFVNQLRQDHQFERLIQSMTTDRIAGRSSLNKNNYRW